MVGMDKAQPIRLHQFHEFDGGRAKNGTQPKQHGPQCSSCFCWLSNERGRLPQSPDQQFNVPALGVNKITTHYF